MDNQDLTPLAEEELSALNGQQSIEDAPQSADAEEPAEPERPQYVLDADDIQGSLQRYYDADENFRRATGAFASKNARREIAREVAREKAPLEARLALLESEQLKAQQAYFRNMPPAARAEYLQNPQNAANYGRIMNATPPDPAHVQATSEVVGIITKTYDRASKDGVPEELIQRYEEARLKGHFDTDEFDRPLSRQEALSLFQETLDGEAAKYRQARQMQQMAPQPRQQFRTQPVQQPTRIQVNTNLNNGADLTPRGGGGGATNGTIDYAQYMTMLKNDPRGASKMFPEGFENALRAGKVTGHELSGVGH